MVQDFRPANLQTGAMNSVWPDKTRKLMYSELESSNDKQHHGLWHGEVILEDHVSAMAAVGAPSVPSLSIHH